MNLIQFQEKYRAKYNIDLNNCEYLKLVINTEKSNLTVPKDWDSVNSCWKQDKIDVDLT